MQPVIPRYGQPCVRTLRKRYLQAGVGGEGLGAARRLVRAVHHVRSVVHHKPADRSNTLSASYHTLCSCYADAFLGEIRSCQPVRITQHNKLSRVCTIEILIRAWSLGLSDEASHHRISSATTQTQSENRTHEKPVALSAATNTILLRPYPRKRSSNQGISRRETMPHGSYRLQYSIWYGSCADTTLVSHSSWVSCHMAPKR